MMWKIVVSIIRYGRSCCNFEAEAFLPLPIDMDMDRGALVHHRRHVLIHLQVRDLPLPVLGAAYTLVT